MGRWRSNGSALARTSGRSGVYGLVVTGTGTSFTQPTTVQTKPGPQQAVPARVTQTWPLGQHTPLTHLMSAGQQIGAAAVPQARPVGQHAPPTQALPSGQQIVPLGVAQVRVAGQTHVFVFASHEKPGGQQIGTLPAAPQATEPSRQPGGTHLPSRQTVPGAQQMLTPAAVGEGQTRTVSQQAPATHVV